MKKSRWKEITELYHAAMELPENERAAFLDSCVNDDLRREVSSLLANEGKADSLLEASALDAAARMEAREPSPLIGTQLEYYQIVSELGKGGMGKVYQAKDQKLGRDVAIKVLPEEFAKDHDRVARFQREAKLLASLNHPNIATIHGLEEADGTHFLVLELIEGDTLADRLKRGAIQVEESLKLALQIAEALEAAHEKGVIHRDLKPANIKVTPDGKVKILDFGLAKAYAGDKVEANLLHSPNLSDVATQQGVILGTAAYMSPEQAHGKSVDKRADIWAFGCVLFEMLTGRAAFSGRDATDILAAVIRAEPEWNNLPANLHWRLREVLEKCLEKEAKDRFHDIADVRVDIQRVLADPSGVLVQPFAEVEGRTRLRAMLPWLAAAVVLTAIIVGVVIWNLRPTHQPEPRRVNRFYYELPEDQEFTNTGWPVVAVSADGTKIVYVANQQLYLRNFDELTARPIQGTDENPTTPFFSSDGQWVGYWSMAENQLKKITASGGASVTLCDASNPYGVTWGVDDSILFGQEAGIMGVSANGGPAELIVETGEGELVYGPQLLPNGEWILFTFAESDASSWDEAQIVVQSLETGEKKVIVSRGSDARYVPTGHLTYAVGGVLYAIAFDSDRLEVTGGAVPIVEDVQRAFGGFTGAANYGFSDTGMLAYVVDSAETLPPRRLIWVTREGKEEPIEAPPNAYRFPKISPDGSQVAVAIVKAGNSDIYIGDLGSGRLTRLTFDEASDVNPIWTPDGQRIVFISNRAGSFSIYWKAADGIGEVEQLDAQPATLLIPASWSNDGNTLLLTEVEGVNWNIGMLSIEGDRAITPLLQEEYVEIQPQISPDGRWIAYTSNESDQNEVYVRPFPEVGKGRWQVSTSGGESPLWSPDGRELFYLIGDSLMAVAVETEPMFSAGKPRMLFRGPYITGYAENVPWDVSPDGKRFLMMKPTGSADAAGEIQGRKINIVLNWFEDLKERVPVE